MLVVVFHILTETVLNKLKANLSRKSFLTLCLASILSACSSRRDLMSMNKSAESLFPPLGNIEKVNGLDFHSLEMGMGASTAIFIHGASINLRDWVLANSPLTTSSYKSIYIDRPGFGYSRRDKTNCTAKKQAMQIRSFAQKNNIKKPVLVGHSWGAIVALEWASEYPDELLGVVSVSGVNMPYSKLVEWLALAGILEPAVEIYSSNIASIHFSSLIERFSQKVFTPQEIPKGYLQKVGVDLIRRDHTILANSEDLAQTAIALATLAEKYPRLTLPVEVIHGEEDVFVRASLHAYDFVTQLPNANLTILKGVGHMAHHADPYSVRSAIERILLI
jgi:pimeloyl-ACP methyl ester carboxylesterase